MAYKYKQSGFTIVEMMIAMSVFSVMALLVSIGVIYIGRSYQQGVERTKLLDASRQIHAQFIQAVEYGSSSTGVLPMPYGTDIYNVWCAGATRFIWLNSSGNTLKGNLYNDVVTGVGACQTPGTFNPSTSKKLLPARGFVTEFTINPIGSGVIKLSTRFAMGQPDMFKGNDVLNTCDSLKLIGTEFCSVVQYDSTAIRKVGTGS